MDRNLTSLDVDSIKKMILAHEEIFKQQVQELHRLYNVQKKLMKEPENPMKHRNEMEHSTEVLGVRDDPIVSRNNSRIPIIFDLEKPVEPTLSRTCDLSEEQKDDLRNSNEESNLEVELTLGLGHYSKKYNRSYPHKCHSSGLTGLDRKLSNSSMNGDEDCVEPSSIVISSSSGNVCQENTRPHWLFQDLGSNRT